LNFYVKFKLFLNDGLKDEFFGEKVSLMFKLEKSIMFL